MSQRRLAVWGTFYPKDPDEIKRYIEYFNELLFQNHIKILNPIQSRAIIVPHAGYIYSGFTANIAYQYIPKGIENIIVIGPSHRFGFDGASVSCYDQYPTPFGGIKINKNLALKLRENYPWLGFYDEVHQEHSTETQFPFIKYYRGEKEVIEIIYSSIEYQDLAILVQELLEDPENFLVISTDLSHFYPLKIAKQKDTLCIEAILDQNIELFKKGCEACGMTGVKALIQAIKDQNYTIKLLDYRTSADTTKDSQSVVGYSSFVIYQSKETV